MKYIIVSGGVLSGLGKGIFTASLGLLLKSYGVKVTAFKCDMYLNIDAGTMNPLEHGEVFVTHDGLETDQDLGHYERFINTNLSRYNYTTNGQVYKSVLDKERSLDYEGACVQPYHHIPPEIIKRWEIAGRENKADVILIEMGGTVGEYEGLLFFEAARRIKLKEPDNICFIHVGYLPTPGNIGELKSKPLQQSVYFLNTMGIQPDFIVCRASKDVDEKRKEKISLASGVPLENIISSPDLDSVYKVPLKLEEQNFTKKVAKKMNIKIIKNDLKEWKSLIKRIDRSIKEINISIVGKYQKTGDYLLEDAYVSVVEALKHAGFKLKVKLKIKWVNSEDLESLKDSEIKEIFNGISGIIVPQGWGKRGVEGKIRAVNYARLNNIPYLGLCFGMQMAVIEFSRSILGFKDANSQEVNPKSSHKVIHLMDNQKEYLKKHQYGGTIRLGAWPCIVKSGTKLESIYKKYGGKRNNPWFLPNPLFSKKVRYSGSGTLIYERHRHRYEFNNEYREIFEKNGLIISGISPFNSLVEAIEIKNHPFFIGVQFHPEYLSRPLSPHPIFISFLESSMLNQ